MARSCERCGPAPAATCSRAPSEPSCCAPSAAVAAGDAILGPGVARRLPAYLAPTPPDAAAPFPELTEREREILGLVAQGRSNAEITTQLVVSPKTVRNHVSNIFAKLGVRDRAEAIVRAREAGLGHGDRPS